MFRKIIALFVCLAFITVNYQPVAAQEFSITQLPAPGTMVNLSPAYAPLLMKGVRVHPENPLLFDFIIDTGHSGLNTDTPQLRKESEKLIKYFLATLTTPEKDLWVNLSPYEKDRMIPEQLGQTELGRDMLAQDYMLKQLTASLIYPEKELGKNFWDKVYAQAQQRYGTTQVPVNTFNKVWILPDKAGVFVRNNTAYVVEGHLKVMLEEDYLAREKNSSTLSSPNVSVGGPVHASPGFPTKAFGNDKNATSQIVRQIILPAIENEVNTAKNFAPLRQIFYSLVLASWYKKNLKQALLNQVYSDKNKINGVDADDKQIGQKIYQQYLAAYKKGVFNYIKEDASTALSTGVDHLNKQSLPRKYFSGGEVFSNFDLAMFTNPANPIVQRGLPTGPQLYVSAAVKNAGPDAAMIGSVTAERVSLERQRVYAASQGSHEQRRVAEFEYVRNRFGDESLKRELGVDYEGLYNFFIGQVRSNGDLEITREIADRFKESLWEIAINQLDGHVRKVRVRTNYNDPELGSSDEDTGDAHVIYFPLASNPLHSGQIETALRAMAQSKASQVVFRVQGLDFRKEITGATIDGRHEITDGFMRELSKFAPGLFAYSAIGKENDLDGETDYLNFLKLNAGRKGKLRVDYLVGSDHMHYWDKQGRPDTIQKFEKFADEQAEFLRDHNIRFMVLFNERDPQDSKPRPNEEAKLQELKSKGFYILLRGANLEGASSTLIRNALAGFGKAEDLTIMPLYVEQQIKERGKYRGFIVGLPEAISHLAQGKAETNDKNILANWLATERANGRTPTLESIAADFNLKDFPITKEDVQKAIASLDKAMNAVLGKGRDILQSIQTNIERGYDVRGIAIGPKATMTPDTFYASGIALGLYAKDSIKGRRPRALVTGDQRSTTPELRRAISEGMALQGMDVDFSDEFFSTPAANVVARLPDTGYDIVVQITASHNAWTNHIASERQKDGFFKEHDPENGLKINIRGADGQFRGIYGEGAWTLLSRAFLSEAERPSDHPGTIRKVEILDRYYDHLAGLFKKNLASLGLTLEEARERLVLVVDTGNGVMGPIVKVVIQDRLGIPYVGIDDEVITSVDGLPAHEADPSKRPVYDQHLTKAVQEVTQRPENQGKTVLGIAFDGDGDRVGMTDEGGLQYLTPNQQGYFLFSTIQQTDPNSGVVLDIRAGQEIIEELGLKVEQTHWHAPGWPIVRKAMQEAGAAIAVEGSHHTMLRQFDDPKTDAIDDGLYVGLFAAAQALKLRTQGRSIRQLLERPWYSSLAEELRPGVSESVPGERYELMPEIARTIGAQVESVYQGARIQRIPSPGERGAVRLQISASDGTFIGWILIRASNTSPRLSLQAQGKDATTIKRLAEILGNVLARFNKINQDDVKNVLAKTLGDQALIVYAVDDEMSLDHSGPEPTRQRREGGIDFNKSMNINAGGDKVDIRFDKAMMRQFMSGDFTGVRPQILGVTFLPSVLPLFGLGATRKEDEENTPAKAGA